LTYALYKLVNELIVMYWLCYGV